MSKNNRSRRYTEECKGDAVELAPASDKTVTEVARDLGVSAEGLRGWVKQAKADRGQDQPGELTSAEREQLKRLRRQLTVRNPEIVELARHYGTAIRTCLSAEGALPTAPHATSVNTSVHASPCAARPAHDAVLRRAGRRAGGVRGSRIRAYSSGEMSPRLWPATSTSCLAKAMSLRAKSRMVSVSCSLSSRLTTRR
ncbi:transposase [Streptomyces sp. JB150]|nr:transposase [Streptomyces sp. JB150]